MFRYLGKQIENGTSCCRRVQTEVQESKTIWRSHEISFSPSCVFTTWLFVQKLPGPHPFIWCIHTFCAHRRYYRCRPNTIYKSQGCLAPQPKYPLLAIPTWRINVINNHHLTHLGISPASERKVKWSLKGPWVQPDLKERGSATRRLKPDLSEVHFHKTNLIAGSYQYLAKVITGQGGSGKVSVNSPGFLLLTPLWMYKMGKKSHPLQRVLFLTSISEDQFPIN